MSFYISTIPADGLWAACTRQFQSYRALAITLLLVAFLFKRSLGGILNVWPFFTRRYDFIISNFEKTGRNIFSFNALHHSITAVKGVSARKAFFNEKNLNFTEGYKILMGAAPILTDIKIQTEPDTTFIKRLAILFHKDRLAEVIPTLFHDIQTRMDSWGAQGTMDPFKNIYDIVFQMTARMASCSELASDLAALTTFQKHYWILEKSATPVALLFPWFPGSAKRARLASTRALFTTIHNLVEERKKAAVPSSDAIDMFLGLGLSNENIIQSVLSIIFAGVVNTGIISCWILLYISYHASWKFAIRDEVQAILAKHTNSADPLHKRLSAIPITVWEDEMPTLELAIRETIRLAVNGTVLRRNLPGGNGEYLKMHLHGGEIEVPPGGFMAYSLTDAHMNPRIYTDPGVFDPERFSPGREEDKREPYSFLGWGAGRHPCAGMKVAKLEIKMIVAMFVVGYEYDVVDSKGRVSDKLPIPDYNDIQQARPKGDPCFIKFKRVVK